jgi:hypothetical protein
MQPERLRLGKTQLRKAHVAISACLAALAITPAQAQDCCAHVVAPCAAYWNAAAVFVGRVEAVKRAGITRTVSFTVLEGIRGVASSTIDVTTGPAGQRCSLSFKIGHEYVVYADRPDGTGGATSGGLTTSGCSRTRDVEDAAADLEYAHELKEGSKEGSREGSTEGNRNGSAPAGHISGRVLLSPRDLAGTSTGVPRPVPHITVTVTRDGVADTAVTDRAGDVRVESRGPGTYRVSVDVPERFYSDDPVTMVTLRDPRSCAEVAAMLHDNGYVAGRVVDAAGRPVAGLTIELGAANSGQASPSHSFGEARRSLGGGGRRTVTDRDGRYALARIPHGRFLLSVPAGPSRAPGGRPVRIFYPGVGTLAAAMRVALAAGERVGLADFRIPAHQKFVAVSGVVFDADGTPAEGARVYLKGVGEDDRIVSEPVAVDFMGRFVIAALDRTDYRLFAERPRPGGRSSRVDSTDQIPLTAVEGLKLVRLTLERRY